jgi:hypothetical protein
MKKKKKEKRINTFGDLIHLDHLDNCKSFGFFNIFKGMLRYSYIFLIC